MGQQIDFASELAAINFDAELAAMQTPAQPTSAQQARTQADTDTGAYIAQMIQNIPKDALGQVKGVGQLLMTLAGATGELGADIGSTVRDAVGLDPKYQKERPNQAALKAMPGIIAQHYGGYLDADTRAEQVRDHPVGTVIDFAAAVKGGGALKQGAGTVASAAAKRVPGIVAKAGPVVGDVVTDAIPMGRTMRTATSAVLSSLRRNNPDIAPVPSHQPLIDVLDNPAAFRNAATERMTASTSEAALRDLTERLRTQPPKAPTSPQEALLQELMAREIDWRTTDAVPLDAIKRDITQGGTILEAGESQIGLGERLAQAIKNAAKDPKAAAEAERLARALRQRMHIAEGARR